MTTHTPGQYDELMAHLISNEPDPVIIDVTKGMEHVEAMLAEFESQSAADPNWRKSHLVCLNIPGVEDKYCGKLLPMCCAEHTLKVAKSLLQAIALGWTDSWMEAGRHSVLTVFNDKSIGLHEKVGLMNMSVEYFKAGAAETVEKEGWLELIKRDIHHAGQH